ncbi:MAG: hypothetical protein HYR91_08975 [Flavobacteriia bacterium]|nr:hypothetical protein [Flavobacteriia bacterium]
MKKYILILFIGIYFWQFIGMNIHFEHMRYIAKKEANINLKNKSKIIQFNFSSEDYEKLLWIDKNEFAYNESLYDVKEIQKKENQVIVFCLNDTNETDLINSFMDKNQPDPQGKSSKLPTKFWSKLINSSARPSIFNYQFDFSQISKVENIGNNFFHLDRVYKTILEIPIKPPQA